MCDRPMAVECLRGVTGTGGTGADNRVYTYMSHVAASVAYIKYLFHIPLISQHFGSDDRCGAAGRAARAHPRSGTTAPVIVAEDISDCDSDSVTARYRNGSRWRSRQRTLGGCSLLQYGFASRLIGARRAAGRTYCSAEDPTACLHYI